MREKKKKGGGKKCYLPIMVLVIAVAIMGCTTLAKQPDDPFAYAAYGTISTAVATVDLVDSVFYSLRAKREVSDEAWAKYEKIANKTIDSISAASRTMAVYKRGGTTQDVAKVAIQALDASLAELEAYYMSQIPAGQRKPLIR